MELYPCAPRVSILCLESSPWVSVQSLSYRDGMITRLASM